MKIPGEKWNGPLFFHLWTGTQLGTPLGAVLFVCGCLSKHSRDPPMLPSPRGKHNRMVVRTTKFWAPRARRPLIPARGGIRRWIPLDPFAFFDVWWCFWTFEKKQKKKKETRNEICMNILKNSLTCIPNMLCLDHRQITPKTWPKHIYNMTESCRKDDQIMSEI